ncbi:MAG: ParA family protein [Chloroflexi bacterium]|uniref:ParA family protein n=1 Tax=Candidatus Chlorohelix allophototropha TaxID=3003348 RepID=A0A8T7M755_9CHLR|nr:ParA family protein [Chloroflexota bacterium]WJW69885.1 ParA family protein [Chloroflexota bacterium L227-S17]
MAKNSGRAYSLGLSNQKGGAAKTTSAAALAAIYGEKGFRVLGIDSDPQAHLSLQLGVDFLREETLRGTVSDLYLGKASAEEVTVHTRFQGVDLIPASVDLAAVEINLPGMTGCDLRLRRGLEPIRNLYDLIILDSPPNLGKFAVNVLNASDFFIVPVDGPWGLRSVDTLLTLAQDNAAIYNLPTTLLGVFITMGDRTRIMQGVREEAERRFPKHLFKSEIRRSTLAREAAALETPVPLYASDSALAGDYRSLAEEIATRMGL